MAEPQSDAELQQLVGALTDAIKSLEESLHNTGVALTAFAYNRNTPDQEQRAVRLHQQLVRLVLEAGVVRSAAIDLNNALP